MKDFFPLPTKQKKKYNVDVVTWQTGERWILNEQQDNLIAIEIYQMMLDEKSRLH